MQSWKARIIAVLAVIVIAGAAYGIGGVTFSRGQSASAAPILYNEDTVTSIYNTVSPAVVEIDVTLSGSTGLFRNSGSQGQGSGFLVDNQGDIVTNNHVVAGATSVKVILKDGTSLDANVVGTDSLDDLAVVKIDPNAVKGVTPLQFNTTSLRPGQMAIAIGDPYGLDGTVTVGVVSGVNRTIPGSNYTGMVQTDAAINPGNSGGPLLDANGAVIGINTAVETTSMGANGIGFAVSASTASKALPDLVAGKTVTRAWLGVSVVNLDSTLAQKIGVSATQGAYIVSIVTGSPAEAAGLKAGNFDSTGSPVAGGDLITAVDGNAIKTVDDLTKYISSKKAGDQVTLSVLLNNASTTVKVTLGTWPTTAASQTPNAAPNPRVPRMPRYPFGGTQPTQPSN